MAFWMFFFHQVGLDGLKVSDEEAGAPQSAMCHDCFKGWKQKTVLFGVTVVGQYVCQRVNPL